RMYARSEGNPLFTEELLAAGLDGRGELPPTLRDALMVRIEALPQDAQEVLRVISAGRSLDHALLAEASGLESGALREALRGAADKADEVHAHGEAATLYERALQLWSRVPDPEALAGIDHATLLSKAADAHSDKHRAEALYEAALSEIDETAERHRAADLLER